MKALIKSVAPALAALAVVTTVTSVRAQTPFPLDSVGAAAEYLHKDGNGRIESYTRNVVTDISAADPLNHTVENFCKNVKINRENQKTLAIN